MKKVVIIIPTYNEKENITRLIPVLFEVFKTISEWEMNILIVDDSSPDGTADVVRGFAQKHDNVSLHLNAQKSGLGHAYIVGMKKAFDELGADVVFEMDADFQHDPDKIPEFLRAIDNGAELVLGSRYIPGGSIPSHWLIQRKFLSIVGNWINMIVFTNFTIHDWTGGYRAIKKNVFDAVRDDIGDQRLSGYTFQIGFLHKVLRKGFKIVEVPFHFKDRTSGESKLGPDYIKNALMYILTARYQEIVTSHVFKFGVVGGIGFVITATGSILFPYIPFVPALAESIQKATGLFFLNTSALATALATECAIVSNFTLNNFFTFTDRKLQARQVIPKFLQFNAASLGAVVISSVIVGTGTHFTGDRALSKLFWLVIATGIVMFVNFFIYSRIIWKKK
jgi:dolichol-phosphate mannosyltransferase